MKKLGTEKKRKSRKEAEEESLTEINMLFIHPCYQIMSEGTMMMMIMWRKRAPQIRNFS